MGRFLGQNNQRTQRTQRTQRLGLPPRARVTFPNIPPEYKTPGASFTGGGFTLPINPKLTGDEISAIASEEVFVPEAREIQRLTREGIFQSPEYEDVGRTYRQFAGSQYGAGSGLLTAYDPKLQKYQSHVKSIRRYVFGEGGKQLTRFEAKTVMSLIDPIGKNDNQYVEDLNSAVAIIQSKARLARGGLLAARPPTRPYQQEGVQEDVTEDDIEKTMRANNMTREQVLKAILKAIGR